MNFAVPDLEIAREIAASFSQRKVTRVSRFPTGLCHFVFEAILDGDDSLVVRIARPGNEKALAGYVYWENRLRAVGIPVARILHTDLRKEVFPFAYLILERLEGTDLGDAYHGMSQPSKTALAHGIAAIQSATLRLPRSTRFGFALSYEDPGPHRSWTAVIDDCIVSCQKRVKADSLLTYSCLERLEKAAASLQSSLSTIEPVPFLDDITSKNVIIRSDGSLSGIVDVDTLCFGDFLFPLALTRAAFSKLGYDTLYTDAWETALQLSAVQSSHLSLYTALFAADLMSEQGITFNRDTAVIIDPSGAARLNQLFDRELQRVI